MCISRSTLRDLQYRFWLLLCVCAPAQVAAYYGDGFYVDADIGLRYESNLSRANARADIEEDMVTALSAGAGYLKNLDENSQLLVSAYLAHERFAEFSDLNNVAVNSDIVYTIQPRQGYTQPWYRIHAHVAKWEFNESAIRDSYMFSAGLGTGRRFTDKLSMELDYRYQERIADGEVFDTKTHQVQAGMSYSWSPLLTLFATYTLQRGDFTSTATPNPAIIAAATARAPDDVFTPGLGPACMNRRCAYRLDATGHFLEGGLEVSLNQWLSLDVSARHFIVDGDELAAYRGWVYRASLLLQF